ncbi:hypothetical protein H0H92_006765 [Tricholoma furcatifolium]|nr:hypothetical protein H0H92_006765 [Tricholoma furcatifolium]
MTDFDHYDYGVYQPNGAPPPIEAYESSQVDNMFSNNIADFEYQGGAQPLETLDSYWKPGSTAEDIVPHLRPLQQQFMQSNASSNYNSMSWGNPSPSTVSHRLSSSGSGYTPYHHHSPPGSSHSYSSMQGSSDGRRSRSSELRHSPYTNPSHLSSSPTTPHLMQMTVSSGDDAVNLDGYREQLRLFKEALQLPLSFDAGPFVPQKMYMPHTNSDRRRYVEEIELQQPIYFWMESPGECGISLIDALHSRVRRLRQRDEPVFEGRGPSISWPGYRPWSRQIPTKDFRSPPQPITRAKLAKNVAKCVERFLSVCETLIYSIEILKDDQARTGNSLEDDVDPRWKVGLRPHEIKLEDLYLVSMHHVSMGSWQPHLRLRRPLPP